MFKNNPLLRGILYRQSDEALSDAEISQESFDLDLERQIDAQIERFRAETAAPIHDQLADNLTLRADELRAERDAVVADIQRLIARGRSLSAAIAGVDAAVAAIHSMAASLDLTDTGASVQNLVGCGGGDGADGGACAAPSLEELVGTASPPPPAADTVADTEPQEARLQPRSTP